MPLVPVFSLSLSISPQVPPSILQVVFSGFLPDCVTCSGAQHLPQNCCHAQSLCLPQSSPIHESATDREMVKWFRGYAGRILNEVSAVRSSILETFTISLTIWVHIFLDKSSEDFLNLFPLCMLVRPPRPEPLIPHWQLITCSLASSCFSALFCVSVYLISFSAQCQSKWSGTAASWYHRPTWRCGDRWECSLWFQHEGCGLCDSLTSCKIKSKPLWSSWYPCPRLEQALGACWCPPLKERAKDQMDIGLLWAGLSHGIGVVHLG